MGQGNECVLPTRSTHAPLSATHPRASGQAALQLSAGAMWAARFSSWPMRQPTTLMTDYSDAGSRHSAPSAPLTPMSVRAKVQRPPCFRLWNQRRRPSRMCRHTSESTLMKTPPTSSHDDPSRVVLIAKPHSSTHLAWCCAPDGLTALFLSIDPPVGWRESPPAPAVNAWACRHLPANRQASNVLPSVARQR